VNRYDTTAPITRLGRLTHLGPVIPVRRVPLVVGVLASIVLGMGAALASGCVGHITGGDDDPVPDGPRDVCASGDADIPGPRLLRRLTGAELTTSVRAAFQLTAAEWVGPAVPADAPGRKRVTNKRHRLHVDHPPQQLQLERLGVDEQRLGRRCDAIAQ